MRKIVVGLLSVSLASGMGLSLPSAALAAPPVDPPAAAPVKKSTIESDDLPNPLEKKRREMRQQAVSDVVSGRIKPEQRGASTVARVGKTVDGPPAAGARGANATSGGRNQYVELEREKTDRLFVILTEFGNQRHPSYPDKDLDPRTPGPERFDGPLHNQIPAPNRAVDNTTVWQPDYSPDYYRNLYFGTGKNVESVKTYFETQSSGRYSVEGKVTDWVKVPYNEARYGRSNDPVAPGQPGDDPAVCQSSNCANVWQLVRDAANKW
ncbi:MAG TPA: immune inhibitor A domain-containing protein, partial [Catenuloplanes sp.]